jgi:hypothetical protein
MKTEGTNKQSHTTHRLLLDVHIVLLSQRPVQIPHGANPAKGLDARKGDVMSMLGRADSRPAEDGRQALRSWGSFGGARPGAEGWGHD